MTQIEIDNSKYMYITLHDTQLDIQIDRQTSSQAAGLDIQQYRQYYTDNQTGRAGRQIEKSTYRQTGRYALLCQTDRHYLDIEASMTPNPLRKPIDQDRLTGRQVGAS